MGSKDDPSSFVFHCIFIISYCYAFMLITDICLHSVCLPMVTNQWLCSRCGFVASNREEGWLVLWAHTEGEVTLTNAPEHIGRLRYRERVWEDRSNEIKTVRNELPEGDLISITSWAGELLISYYLLWRSWGESRSFPPYDFSVFFKLPTFNSAIWITV